MAEPAGPEFLTNAINWLRRQQWAQPAPAMPPPSLADAIERPPPQDQRSRGVSGDWRSGPIADPTEDLPMWRGLARPYLPAWLGGGPMVTRAESPEEFAPFDVPAAGGVLRAPLLQTKAKYLHPTTGEEPTRVYHGTSKTFGEFDPARASPRSLYGPGHYFTESPTVAGGYAKPLKTLDAFFPTEKEASDFAKTVPDAVVAPSGGQFRVSYPPSDAAPNVRPAHLDIQNPFDIESRVDPTEVRRLLTDAGHPMAKNPQTLDQYVKSNLKGEGVYGSLLAELGSKEAVNAFLQREGYDGITHTGGKITGGEPHRVWIAFSPKQVVSPFEYAAGTTGGRQRLEP